MHLAQELVDYIIDFLHDDRATLILLSLVSRAWVGRSRVHLCETMKITRRKLISSNLSYLAPLCGDAKILHFTWPTDSTDPSVVLDCFEQSKPHTLALHSCELYNHDDQMIRRFFEKFPCTSVTTLELHDISPSHRTFLVLFSLFPNIDDLSISVRHCWSVRPASGQFGNNNHEIGQRTSPPRFSRSFKFFDPPGHGVWGYQRGKLLRTIALLPLQFQTVSLNTKEQYWEDALIFLNSCSKTARKVFVELGPYSSINWAPIDFPNLEELRVGLSWNITGGELHPLLRSITSPCLQRMVIEVYGGAFPYSLLDLDEGLTDLVKRHNTHGNFTLQISTKADPEYVRGMLPLLAREGVLEVRHSARPDYCA